MSLNLSSALIQQIGQLNIIATLTQTQATTSVQSMMFLSRIDLGIGQMQIVLSSISKINREGFEKLYNALKETISNTTKVGKARRAKLEAAAPGTTFGAIEEETNWARDFLQRITEMVHPGTKGVLDKTGTGESIDIGGQAGQSLTKGLGKSMKKGTIKLGKTMMSGILKGAGIGLLLSPLMTIAGGFMEAFEPINDVLTAFGEILGAHLTPYITKLVEWMMKAVPYLESGEKFIGLMKHIGGVILDLNDKFNPFLALIRGLFSIFDKFKPKDGESLLSFSNLDFSGLATDFQANITSAITNKFTNFDWSSLNILDKFSDLWDNLDLDTLWKDFKDDVIDFFKFQWLKDAVSETWDDIKDFFTGGWS